MSFFYPVCPKCRKSNDAQHECCFLDKMIAEFAERDTTFPAMVEKAYRRIVKRREKLSK